MPTVQQSPPRSSTVAAHRSWFARHKLLTTCGVLLALIVVAGYIWAWPLIRFRFHSQYAVALTELRNSATAIERLGEPIDPVRPFPGGTAFDDGHTGEARFNFTVRGPKNTAEVAAASRMQQGQWDLIQLKLTLPDKNELDLMSAIRMQQGNDAARFDPDAKPPDVPIPDMPADITIDFSKLPAETGK